MSKKLVKISVLCLFIAGALILVAGVKTYQVHCQLNPCFETFGYKNDQIVLILSQEESRVLISQPKSILLRLFGLETWTTISVWNDSNDYAAMFTCYQFNTPYLYGEKELKNIATTVTRANIEKDELVSGEICDIFNKQNRNSA